MTEAAFTDRARSSSLLHPRKPAAVTVIKAGTGVLTRPDGSLDRAAVAHLVMRIAELKAAGHRVIYVSSGAVGSGVSAFHLKEYPKTVVMKQACAAVGQARLLQLYGSLFANFDIFPAQVLLNAGDVATEARRRAVGDMLQALLDQPDVLPVVNENDTVSVEGLKFPDNDMLAYHIADIVGAQRMVLLSTVDGLLDPATGALVESVNCVDGVFGHVRAGEKGGFSLGGMMSKLTAVKLAVENGIETHIASGRHPERLAAIVGNKKGVSTLFAPVPRPSQIKA